MNYSYQCSKCNTNVADRWITITYSDSLDDKPQTIIFCPKCYEEEATNAI